MGASICFIFRALTHSVSCVLVVASHLLLEHSSVMAWKFTEPEEPSKDKRILVSSDKDVNLLL